MAEKFDFNPGGNVALPATTELQLRVEALLNWARMVEARLAEMDHNLISLAGSLEGLVSKLVTLEQITEEELIQHRDDFISRVHETREKMRKAAQQQPKLWTPG